MIPAFAVVRVGTWKRAAIPIPIFLVWPLVGLLWVATSIALIFVPNKRTARDPLALASAGAASLFQLSGLRIDVQSRRGERVYLRFI
jgi:hypothetical protein